MIRRFKVFGHLAALRAESTYLTSLVPEDPDFGKEEGDRTTCKMTLQQSHILAAHHLGPNQAPPLLLG